MGGLVARYCETILGCSEYIFKIFTIASPHKGAPLLRHGIVLRTFNTQRHKQMVPGSDFLCDENFTVKCKNKYITYGSIHDIHVPDSYARLDDVPHEVIGGCCHIGIIANDALWKSIMKHLETSETTGTLAKLVTES
jgi:hypothetical protein